MERISIVSTKNQANQHKKNRKENGCCSGDIYFQDILLLKFFEFFLCKMKIKMLL